MYGILIKLFSSLLYFSILVVFFSSFKSSFSFVIRKMIRQKRNKCFKKSQLEMNFEFAFFVLCFSEFPFYEILKLNCHLLKLDSFVGRMQEKTIIRSRISELIWIFHFHCKHKSNLMMIMFCLLAFPSLSLQHKIDWLQIYLLLPLPLLYISRYDLRTSTFRNNNDNNREKANIVPFIHPFAGGARFSKRQYN